MAWPKKVKGGTVVDEEPKVVEEPVEEEAVDEATLALQQAAELMAKAASDRRNRGTILKDVEVALGKLSLVDFESLRESPTIQAFLKVMGTDDLNPGEVRNRGTLAEREREWTMRDVHRAVKEGRMRLVKFVPYKTLDLTFNGLPMRVIGGRECEIPDCFYDIYKDHVRASNEAVKHEAYLLGYSDEPPHPDWQTPEGAIVRAMSTGGRRYGKPGGTLEVGTFSTVEEQNG